MVGGEASQVLPLQKSWGRKHLNQAEGGGGEHKTFGVVLTQVLEVLAMLKGGTTSFHPLKGGGG